MTIKQKQWQLYYIGYYGGGESEGLAGSRLIATQKTITDIA